VTVRFIEVACRLLLAVVFAAALVGKVTGREAFAAFVRSVRDMRVVPPRLARPAALASVATEALITVLLLVPVRWAGVVGFVLAAGLLAAFTAAIASSLRQGNRAPCRCFGVSATPLGPRHIVRNGALVATALLGLAIALTGGSVDVGAGVVAGVAGAFLGLVVAGLDDIVGLLRPAR
jgi:hypothetical protein